MTEMKREVLAKELVGIFDGKYITASSTDSYGITIEMARGTIGFEDDLGSSLYIISRDSENNVTGSICFDEDMIDHIEESGNGTYTISFSIGMADIDISEYKSLEQLQKEHDEKQEV